MGQLSARRSILKRPLDRVDIAASWPSQLLVPWFAVDFLASAEVRHGSVAVVVAISYDWALAASVQRRLPAPSSK